MMELLSAYISNSKNISLFLLQCYDKKITCIIFKKKKEINFIKITFFFIEVTVWLHFG
jgi:hypothetical protein